MINSFKYIFLVLFTFSAIVGCKVKTPMTDNTPTPSVEEPMVHHLADVNVNNLRLDSTKTYDKSIDSLIAPYRREMQKEMGVVINQLDQDLVKRRPNSNLGNWFCDLMLAAGNDLFDIDADFAAQNYGGIRVPSISKGSITKGKIFELMPFDNTLLHLEMNADLVQQLLDRIAEYGGWPISKNLSFTIQDSTATNILIKGEPLSADKTYSVLLPDYIANGGDDCDFLLAAKRTDSGKFIREAVIDHLIKMTENSISNSVDSAERIKMNNE